MIMTDKLAIIRLGKLIQKGSVREIHQRPKNSYVARLFSELNPIPGLPNAFVRPSDVVFSHPSSGIPGKVIAQQYLVSFNRLTILLKDTGLEWKAEDRERLFENGALVYLDYQKEKILQF